MKNRYGLQRWLKTLVLLFCGTSLFGQLPARDILCHEPLLLHFRFDRSLLEADYMDNPRTLREFDLLFSDSLQISRIDTIRITSYASPDGGAWYNSRLAHQRAVAVKGYLVWKYPGLNQYRIVVRPQGEDWTGLRRLVEADAAIPDREDALAILDTVADKERCKLLLRRLNMGLAYRYIHKHLLPHLRNAAVCTIRLIMPADTSVSEKVENEAIPPLFDAEQQKMVSDELPVPLIKDSTSFVTTEEKAHTAYLAVKTNLLLWGGVTPEGGITAFRPNLSAEVFFARRWSVMASAEYSYWQGGKHDKFWGVSGYSLEPRVWLLADGTYRWLYVGVYGQAGDFDYRPQADAGTLQTGASTTGTYWSTGLSVGFYLPLTSRWGLEAGLRGGYRNAAGKAYDYESSHSYFHHNAPSTRWGITGLNFSLTYRLLTK